MINGSAYGYSGDNGTITTQVVQEGDEIMETVAVESKNLALSRERGASYAPLVALFWHDLLYCPRNALFGVLILDN